MNVCICIVQVLKLRYNEIRDAGAEALSDAVKVHPKLGNKFSKVINFSKAFILQKHVYYKFSKAMYFSKAKAFVLQKSSI